MIEMIFQTIFEFVLYFTARLVLPVLSFGRWTVMPLKPEFVLWQGPSFQRLPDGKIGIGPSMASIFGLLLWVLVIVVVAVVVAHKS